MISTGFLSVAKSFGHLTPHANAGFDLSTGPSEVSLVGNVIFPLNQNQGLRTDLTWTLGVEYTF